MKFIASLFFVSVSVTRAAAGTLVLAAVFIGIMSVVFALKRDDRSG